ncbi:MAG TPA: hypothetical protein VIX83_10840 [Candidatus Cybelea sp.]
MPDPLRGYLCRAYFCWYTPLLAVGALSALPLRSFFFYALGPLAAVLSPLALCGVTFALATRQEIETLHAYGTSFHRFWRPLSLAAAISTAAISLASIAIAPNHVFAAGISAVTAAVSSGAFALVVRHAWSSTTR